MGIEGRRAVSAMCLQNVWQAYGKSPRARKAALMGPGFGKGVAGTDRRWIAAATPGEVRALSGGAA